MNSQVNPEIAQKVLTWIQHSPLPVSRSGVQKALKLPVPVIKEVLDSLVQQGQLHTWPGYGRARPAYWIWPRERHLKQLLAEAVAECAMTREELLKAMPKRFPGVGRSIWEATIRQAVRDGLLIEEPPAWGGRAQLLVSPSRPQGYLQAHAALVERLWTSCRRLGIPPKELLCFLSRPPDLEQAATEIYDELVRLQRAPGIPIPISQLRQSLPHIPKETFDRAVLWLSEQGRVWLTRHDDPHSLPPEEFQNLVHDNRGKFYAGIATRTR